LASLLILPAIAEELMIRHYLLRLFPYQRSVIWKWIAVVATSLLFAIIHTQYDSWTTLALIFVGVLAVCLGADCQWWFAGAHPAAHAGRSGCGKPGLDLGLGWFLQLSQPNTCFGRTANVCAHTRS